MAKEPLTYGKILQQGETNEAFVITAEQIHLVKGKLAKSDTLNFYNLYIIPK